MKMPEASGAVGILGGTFDPVHNAHLALARVALEKLGLAQVMWIPAGQPPHRAAPLAEPSDRLAMVSAAIAGEPRFTLDASEVASTAASYTVHTLKRLRQTLGASRPLVLLMGADAFRSLPDWYHWQEIFDLAHIAVATRPGFPLESFDGQLAAEFAARHPVRTDFSSAAGQIATFELIAGTVSATEVRSLIAAGAPREKLAGLVPTPVLDYIHQHSLYLN
jgi:nicotinate-nucleotide adenylyltransferase